MRCLRALSLELLLVFAAVLVVIVALDGVCGVTGVGGSFGEDLIGLEAAMSSVGRTDGAVRRRRFGVALDDAGMVDGSAASDGDFLRLVVATGSLSEGGESDVVYDLILSFIDADAIQFEGKVWQ